MAARGSPSGMLWISGLLAFALIGFGGALFYNEKHNPVPQPDIESSLATVAAGTETTCTFAPATTAPRCRVEGNWTEYPRRELFCFCPATIADAATGTQSSAEVFLGPETDMSKNTVAGRQDWCNTELAKPLGWENVITFESVSNSSWSCNVITTRVGEPCGITNAQLYEDLEGNAHCISSMLQGTREHYQCLSPIISNTAVPCVRDSDGRVLVGTKLGLQTQLGAHQDHFDTQELWMSTVAGAMLGSGVVIFVLTLLCCVGQIAMGGKEDSRKYKRQGDDWSEDYSSEVEQ